ncbi:MerR family transcriptional regulator [Spongiactinospora gelatinilytica]|uniref:MerR family transcriptional regulator n=2 Tax=Spongiactinospora gelatinilytica TaxID=2666298 RepID=A0A2W2FWI8_9ACTN|nr:MerR family transcriptional regulator [Spongiactinospora gelatinilytica]PZG34459.1 MerR family transcriptional regulator [Spongiactinospora gelatinilytica]
MNQTAPAPAAGSRRERPRHTLAKSADNPAPSGDSPERRLDDEDYPAYSMGRAAEILGVTPAFLRSLGAAKLIEPLRSEGGHRRFSRYQLRLASRARELVDQGTPLEAACRIIILEDQLAEALRINEELRRRD